MDDAGVLVDEIERGGPVRGDEHDVPLALENRPHEIPDRRLVLDEKDRLRPGKGEDGWVGAGGLPRGARARKRPPEGRPRARGARDAHVPAALLDNAEDGREA